jgi:hypothetical protein
MTINELIESLNKLEFVNGETPVYHYDADGKYVQISAPKIIYLDENKRQALREKRGDAQIAVSISW